MKTYFKKLLYDFIFAVVFFLFFIIIVH